MMDEHEQRSVIKNLISPASELPMQEILFETSFRGWVEYIEREILSDEEE